MSPWIFWPLTIIALVGWLALTAYAGAWLRSRPQTPDELRNFRRAVDHLKADFLRHLFAPIYRALRCHKTAAQLAERADHLDGPEGAGTMDP